MLPFVRPIAVISVSARDIQQFLCCNHIHNGGTYTSNYISRTIKPDRMFLTTIPTTTSAIITVTKLNTVPPSLIAHQSWWTIQCSRKHVIQAWKDAEQLKDNVVSTPIIRTQSKTHNIHANTSGAIAQCLAKVRRPRFFFSMTQFCAVLRHVSICPLLRA